MMRRDNRGIECSSDLACQLFYYIVAVDISCRVDLAAAAAIWHLRGVNWYLERYYAITICVCMWTQRDGEQIALSTKLRTPSARTMLVYHHFSLVALHFNRMDNLYFYNNIRLGVNYQIHRSTRSKRAFHSITYFFSYKFIISV